MFRLSMIVTLIFSLLPFYLHAEMKNPYTLKPEIVKEGADIFRKNCEVCHGQGGRGDICPDLTKKNKKYGNSDSDLFTSISKGRPGGMPNWDTSLGSDRIWKVIIYLRSIEK